MRLLFVLTALIVLLVTGIHGGRRDSCSSGPNMRQEIEKFKQSMQLLDMKDDAKCDACDIAVLLTRDYIDEHNKTDKDIEDIIKFFCVVLKIEDPNVCSSIVGEYQTLFFYLIANKQITSKFVCGVVGWCPKALFPSWNVTLSPTPPPAPYPGPNSKNPSMYVLHVTDIHIDTEYTPGLSVHCGEPICCRPPNPVSHPGAGLWGEYPCDLSIPLYENMLEWISKNLPSISYAIFTGDIPAHDVWNINRTNAEYSAKIVTDAWKRYLPNITLYPAVGNHESVPVNEFAPHSVGGYWNQSWLYEALATRWAGWLPPSALEQVQYAGYYSTLTADGVRIVSMNTNMGCNNENMFLSFPSSESADPDQQLQWLADTLDQAEKNKEIVYLIKHIAPSGGNCGNDWWRNFLNIVDRYKNNILGDFAGHTHDDILTVTYKLINSTSVRPIITTYFPGSVTPYSNENPGFRVYEIDRVTKAIIDYTEYAINLTQTNLQGYPEWRPIYSARSAYTLPDMSPNAWHAASLRMGSNATLLYEYWSRNGKLALQDVCDSGCLYSVWCDLWNPPADTNVNICGL